jgi:hypothetical protein
MNSLNYMEPQMNSDKHRLKEKSETIRVHLCLSVVKKVLELKS